MITLLQLLLQISFLAAVDPDFLRSVGKIYVVVAVLVVIFIGIAVFLFFLDNKISTLEKRLLKVDPTIDNTIN